MRDVWRDSFCYLNKDIAGDLIKSGLSFKEMICSRGGVPKLMKMRLLRWCCNYISPLARLLVLVPANSLKPNFLSYVIKICCECSIDKEANMLFISSGFEAHIEDVFQLLNERTKLGKRTSILYYLLNYCT